MDQLFKKLDAETVAIIEREKINETSLRLITDEALAKMGIVQAGPRMIILNHIEEMRANAVQIVPPHDGATPLSRDNFVADVDFRNKYLYRVLDNHLVPDDTGLRALTRIACKQMSERIKDGGRYATVAEMQQIAESIMTVFPHLAKTRQGPEAPPESHFFWLHSGRGKGPHSGTIYHHIRNVVRTLPKELLKYRRTPKVEIIRHPLPEELFSKAEQMKMIEVIRPNFRVIAEDMESCFPIHQRMLDEHCTAEEILDTFPHLLSFRGVMLHQAYLRIYPNLPEEEDLREVLAWSLLLKSNRFGQVADPTIRGCLRLMASMPVRGLRREATADTQDERDARPFIQWFTPNNPDSDDSIQRYAAGPENMHPHIVCLAAPTSIGRYCIYIGSRMLADADTADMAISIWFRTFPVLGIKVPIQLVMIWDFLACAVYHIQTASKRSTVNAMVRTYMELREARQSTAGPSTR